MRLVIVVVATLMAACAATGAAADDILRVYARVLSNPTDTQANLDYARLAEQMGKLRWALAAYERVTINDPGNAEGWQGLARVRRQLQFDSTVLTAEVGAAWETNPRYTNDNPANPTRPRGELQGFGSIQLRDDRSVGDMRWRTNASTAGVWHSHEDDLDYAYTGVTTGPVLDFYQGSIVALGFGGGASVLQHHFFYDEALATATLEKEWNGALQTVTLRGGYRDYDQFFPATHGLYSDLSGRFSFPNALMEGNLLVLAPWYRWSGIGGTGVGVLLNEIQPGAYSEVGGRASLVRTIVDGVAFGPTYTAFARNYRDTLVAGPGPVVKRHDLIAGPGAILWMPGLFPQWTGVQTAFKVEYQYYRDDSNDPTHTFNDHIVTSSFVFRY